MFLPSRYALSGTDIAYAAPRSGSGALTWSRSERKKALHRWRWYDASTDALPGTKLGLFAPVRY